jgi:porin
MRTVADRPRASSGGVAELPQPLSDSPRCDDADELAHGRSVRQGSDLAGVYDVNRVRNKQGHGFDLSFKHTRGAFVPIEVGYDHGKTPSDYASGLLVQAAQQIWKPHPDTVRGIAVFGVYTEADRKTGLLPAYYELGSSWRGPFASRPDDVLSVSGVQANINTRVRDAERFAGKDARTHEQMWELNYGVQVRPWLLVRPAVQYVVHPGGDRNRPDTAVFVCHFQAVF